MKNQFLKQLLKPFFLLAALIIICGFLVRILTDSETLSEYAAKNPELAYGSTDEHIDEEETESNGDAMSVKATLEPSHDTAADDETAIQNTGAADLEAADSALQDNAAQTPDTDDIPADRITYQEGFYYESLTDSVKKKITGISYPVTAAEASSFAIPAVNTLREDAAPAISYEELRYLSVLYYDFNGEIQTGEIICNKGIVEDLAEIFYELYANEYQIEKIRLIDEYQGDDTASMTDNNTSCFNYRVVDGTTSLSKHALGCAIDINPFYNPYIVFNKDGSGETYISPAGSEVYADRSKNFPYKIDENDLCYKLFKEHGFVWGGDWNSCKDYQHFEKVVE